MSNYDLFRLSISVTHADGRVTRWGPDEFDTNKVPAGLTFGTSIPGGHKDMSVTLPRKITLSSDDLNLFDDVRVYGPGNQTAWEGRAAQFPRAHEDSDTVQVGCVGWVAHMRDDPTFREIYIDRDLGRWGSPFNARAINLGTAFLFSGSSAVVGDDTTQFPLLRQQFTELENTSPPKMLIENVYNAQGVAIGEVFYDCRHYENGAGGYDLGMAGNWLQKVALSADDSFGVSTDDSGNVGSGSADVGVLTATTDTRIYAMVQLYYNAAIARAQGDWRAEWRNLAVIGNHGLTVRGRSTTASNSPPASDPGGFYASDMIADVISRACPKLTYTTGADGSIEASVFAIPHAVFIDPTTADDVVSKINAYHLYDWGVYDDREFFWRQPTPDRLTWEARLSEGARIQLDGETAEQVFNGVLVQWSDPSGNQHTVGPSGSGADTEDDSLADTSVANPLNQHGLTRTRIISLSVATTEAGAIQIGARYLAEMTVPTRRGQMTLTGLVMHPTKGKRPVWEIRAGDYVRISDHPADVPRKIIETSYTHDSRQITLTLDNTALRVDALLERLGIQSIGHI
jgi:hypothetical protein